jgi:hypothetical protein
MDTSQTPDDPVQAMAEVLTSMCASFYGRHGARNAVTAIKHQPRQGRRLPPVDTKGHGDSKRERVPGTADSQVSKRRPRARGVVPRVVQPPHPMSRSPPRPGRAAVPSSS